MRCQRLSLVLPNHNEVDNVEAVVSRCMRVLPQVVDEFEIIIVDDGSTDGTAEIADRVSAEIDEVTVIHHTVNQGYGAALRSGFEASAGDAVMFMDSDRQFDISDITALLPYVPHYDIVAGYRIQRRDPAYRRFYAWLFELSVWILFGVHVRDVDCAFKIYDGDLIRSLKLTMPGALINTEMLALARRRDASIVQVGVHHYPRSAGEQSGGSPKVVFRAMGETLKLWWRLRSMESAEDLQEATQSADSTPSNQLNMRSVTIVVVAFIVAIAAFVVLKRRLGSDDSSQESTPN